MYRSCPIPAPATVMTSAPGQPHRHLTSKIYSIYGKYDSWSKSFIEAHAESTIWFDIFKAIPKDHKRGLIIRDDTQRSNLLEEYRKRLRCSPLLGFALIEDIGHETHNEAGDHKHSHHALVELLLDTVSHLAVIRTTLYESGEKGVATDGRITDFNPWLPTLSVEDAKRILYDSDTARKYVLYGPVLAACKTELERRATLNPADPEVEKIKAANAAIRKQNQESAAKAVAAAAAASASTSAAKATKPAATPSKMHAKSGTATHVRDHTIHSDSKARMLPIFNHVHQR